MQGAKEVEPIMVNIDPGLLVFELTFVLFVSVTTFLTVAAHHWIPLAQRQPLPRICRYGLLVMAAAAFSGCVGHVIVFGSQIDIIYFKYVLLLRSCIGILLIIIGFVCAPYHLSALYRIIGWDQEHFLQNALNPYTKVFIIGCMAYKVCFIIVATYLALAL